MSDLGHVRLSTATTVNSVLQGSEDLGRVLISWHIKEYCTAVMSLSLKRPVCSKTSPPLGGATTSYLSTKTTPLKRPVFTGTIGGCYRGGTTVPLTRETRHVNNALTQLYVQQRQDNAAFMRHHQEQQYCSVHYCTEQNSEIIAASHPFGVSSLECATPQHCSPLGMISRVFLFLSSDYTHCCFSNLLWSLTRLLLQGVVFFH